MDWGTLLGPAVTGAIATFEDVVPIAVPALVAFAALAIGLKTLGKFGIRR